MPQNTFGNVIAGDMSLIGPRPIVVEEIERYGEAFRHYCACRPGMTGLLASQWPERRRLCAAQVKFDEQYATGWSFLASTSLVLCCTVQVAATLAEAEFT